MKIAKGKEWEGERVVEMVLAQASWAGITLVLTFNDSC